LHSRLPRRPRRGRAGAGLCVGILSSLLITILAFVWVGTYAALGLWRSALIPFASQVASLVGLVFFARTKRSARCSTGRASSTRLALAVGLGALLPRRYFGAEQADSS